VTLFGNADGVMVCYAVGSDGDRVVVKVALCEEATEHVEGAERLIERGLMTGTLDGGKGIGIKIFYISSSGTVDEPRRPNFEVLSVELGETGLIESEGNSGYVHISGVDEDRDGRIGREEFPVVRNHRGTRGGVVDLGGTGSPGSRTGMDGLLNIWTIKVIKSTITKGLFAFVGIVISELEGTISLAEILVEIIGVERGLIGRGTSNSLERTQLLDKLLIDYTDLGGGKAADVVTTRTAAVLITTMSSPVLIIGVTNQSMPVEEVELNGAIIYSTAKNAITNHDALKTSSQFNVGTLQNLVGKCGNVDSAIAFACDPQAVVLEFGVDLVPQTKEGIVVLSSLQVIGIVIARGIRIRETNTTRRFNVEHVRYLCPGEGICSQTTNFIRSQRTVLFKQTEQARASRTTLQPEYQRIIALASRTRHKPVEDVSPMRRIYRHVTGIHLRELTIVIGQAFDTRLVPWGGSKAGTHKEAEGDNHKH